MSSFCEKCEKCAFFALGARGAEKTDVLRGENSEFSLYFIEVVGRG